MKCLAIVFTLMLILSPIVMAEDIDYESGIGTDLVVFENEGNQNLTPDEITIENKWDFSNEKGSTYVVAKYNLWERFFSNKKEE